MAERSCRRVFVPLAHRIVAVGVRALSKSESTWRFTSSAAAQRFVAAPAGERCQNLRPQAQTGPIRAVLTFAQMMGSLNPRDNQETRDPLYARRRSPPVACARRHLPAFISIVTPRSQLGTRLLRYSRATSDDTRVPNAPLSSHQSSERIASIEANAKRPDSPKTSLLRGGLVT